jgi:hypothetical protein
MTAASPICAEPGCAEAGHAGDFCKCTGIGGSGDPPPDDSANGGASFSPSVTLGATIWAVAD